MNATDFRNKDYHMHSNYSDGELSPQELIDKYIAEGYEEIAITDHDGMEGAWRAKFYAEGKSIRVISGVEMSTEDDEGHDIHMLGYGINMLDKPLNDALLNIRRWRDERNAVMFERLLESGYEITMEDVREGTSGNFVGKPNFARAMVKHGYGADTQEIFNTIFKDPRYDLIPKKKYNIEQVIDLIHNAGGVAVFAHPFELKKRTESMQEFLPRLYRVLENMLALGFDGIECYHPSADSEQSELLQRYALEHNLIVTKGSDYHAENWRDNYED